MFSDEKAQEKLDETTNMSVSYTHLRAHET